MSLSYFQATNMVYNNTNLLWKDPGFVIQTTDL